MTFSLKYGILILSSLAEAKDFGVSSFTFIGHTKGCSKEIVFSINGIGLIGINYGLRTVKHLTCIFNFIIIGSVLDPFKLGGIAPRKILLV